MLSSVSGSLSSDLIDDGIALQRLSALREVAPHQELREREDPDLDICPNFPARHVAHSFTKAPQDQLDVETGFVCGKRVEPFNANLEGRLLQHLEQGHVDAGLVISEANREALAR